MSISEPSKITVPFADSGLKNAIPQTANNTTGKAGFDKGFPERTMLPKASGGIPPSGMDFNGILYDITSAIRYMQAGGKPTYDAAFAAAIGGYPSGAVLIGDDGVSVFQNAVAGNETDPNSGGAGWTRPDLQVMELYRRSYAEAGYNLVDGSFEQGGTLDTSTDVLLYEAEGKAYSWGGALSKTVAAGSTPVSTGGAWVDRTDLTLRSDLASESGSGEVGYQQAGTGAVATTVQSKLREFVSVKDFGAVGDGVADDWAAINRAINSGAQNIYFPAGTYYCTKALLIYNTCTLYGETGFQSGPSPSILQFADTTCGIVVHRINTTCDAYGYNQTTGSHQTGGDGTVIRYLTIRRGNGADTTIDGITHGVRFRARAHVDSCYISGFAGDGIHILATSGSETPASEGNANNWSVSNTRIQNCRDGIFVDGADVNVGMGLHVDTSSNQRYGIYDSSFLGCNWIGCHANGNTDHEFFHDNINARSVFLGCYVESGGSVVIADKALILGGSYAGVSVTGGQQWIDSVIDLSGTANVGGLSSVGGTTGTGRYVETWNQGSISAARRVAYNFQIGLTTNFMPVGSVYGRGGASNSYSTGVVGLEVYDGSAPTTVAITNVTQANPGVITTGSAHGFVANDRVVILRVGGMTQLNGSYLVNTTPTSDTFTIKTLDGTVVNTTAFSAYTSGGTVGKARGYVSVLEALYGTTPAVVPGLDNIYSLGGATSRWKEVFAVNGTINTSDAREKQQVRELSEAERAVAVRLKGLIRAFKWNEAVEQKGESARIHVGVIAQDVVAAFEAEGLVAEQYAVLCYDEWDERQEVVDENTGEVLVTYRPAGNRYGVRYKELLAFIIGAL